MSNLNVTCFNKELVTKIMQGIREANQNNIAHIPNKKGENILAIRKRVFNNKTYFLIHDKKGNNKAKDLTTSVINKGIFKTQNGGKKEYTLELNQFMLDRVLYEHQLRELTINEGKTA